MIEFKNKIRVLEGLEIKIKWAKHHKVGEKFYDTAYRCWEVGEDVHFNKFWFREVKK